jgi:Ni,Fe-hydrogenase III small subunit
MSWLNNIISRSITLFVAQAGGCNGCALHFSMAMSMNSGIKGITITGNPKHADALLVTGCINEKSRESLKAIYEQIPSPKAVIAVGACACSGSLFRIGGKGLYPAEDIFPVDAWIRGCPPNINEMLHTVVKAIECSLEKEESGIKV